LVLCMLAVRSTGSQLETILNSETTTSGTISSSALPHTSTVVVSHPIRVGDPVHAPSFLEYTQGAGRQRLKVKLDHAVMRFMAAAGLPAAILDYSEWKELCGVFNPAYSPLTRGIYTDVVLPAEQAHIQTLQLDILKAHRYLTITFDGGTTHRQDGFYTIHACTPEGDKFLLDMVNGRGVSHTRDWIKGHLSHVSVWLYSLLCLVDLGQLFRL
jgi:hypothetical protein